MTRLRAATVVMLSLGVVGVGSVGCEIVAAVDRSQIVSAGGGSTTTSSTGGSGGTGGGECSVPADCGDDTDCVLNTCEGGMCGVSNVAENTSCSDGANCDANNPCVCDGEGMCVPGSCLDGLLNGDESDVDCGGACGDNCALGDMCNTFADCADGFCDNGTCSECQSSVDCQSDKYCDTAGATNTCAPDKGQGEACGDAAECPGDNCVDGVCCDTACDATCQSCLAADTGGSDGTCDDISAGGDPDDECTNGACNGGGACALDNGQPCGGSGECASGFCADGVCCNSACGGTCQSCLGADTGGSNGSCGNITSGTDPDNECTNGSCDAGSCKLDNGASCNNGGECLSTFCADGVCCTSDCLGTCKSCLGADTGGANGTCADITSGDDPDNECTNGACDAGTCKLDDGQKTCTSGSDCLSGNCAPLADGATIGGVTNPGICCDAPCNDNAQGGADQCKSCEGQFTGGADGVCALIGVDSMSMNVDPLGSCNGTDCCRGSGGSQGNCTANTCAAPNL